MDKIMITIGRQFGSGGREIGKKIARELEIPYYDKELLAVAGLRWTSSRTWMKSIRTAYFTLFVWGGPIWCWGTAIFRWSVWRPRPSGRLCFMSPARGAASSWDVARTTSCGTKPACSVSLFPPVWTSAFSVWSNATV